MIGAAALRAPASFRVVSSPQAILKLHRRSSLDNIPATDSGYRQEILTFQIEREKLFRFAHIAYP